MLCVFHIVYYPTALFKLEKFQISRKIIKIETKYPYTTFTKHIPPLSSYRSFSLSLSIFQTHTLSELFESKLLEHDPPTFCISPNNKDILNCHNAMIAFSKLSINTMLPSQQGSFRKHFPWFRISSEALHDAQLYHNSGVTLSGYIYF